MLDARAKSAATYGASTDQRPDLANPSLAYALSSPEHAAWQTSLRTTPDSP